MAKVSLPAYVAMQGESNATGFPPQLASSFKHSHASECACSFKTECMCCPAPTVLLSLLHHHIESKLCNSERIDSELLGFSKSLTNEKFTDKN